MPGVTCSCSGICLMGTFFRAAALGDAKKDKGDTGLLLASSILL